MRQYKPIACKTCGKTFTPWGPTVKTCRECGPAKKERRKATTPRRNAPLPSPHEMLAELMKQIEAREKQYVSLVALVEAIYAKTQRAWATLSDGALEKIKAKLAEAYFRLAGEELMARKQGAKAPCPEPDEEAAHADN